MEYACPVCGAGVSGDATECASCGESFATNGYTDEIVANGNIGDDTTDGIDTDSIEGASEEDSMAEISAIDDELAELEDDSEFSEEVTVEETSELEILPADDIDDPDELSVGDQDDLEIPEDDEIAPDDLGELPVDYLDKNTCEGCGASLGSDDVACEKCGDAVGEVAEGDVCPSCGSKDYTLQKGDLVSCDNCGNVYIHENKIDGPDNSWKWKFWGGLILILVGDFGFALASYLHNALRWSPLGDMYLGYGWMDSMLGGLGVVIFIVGLVLFAWSFKRDREVDCPSCGVHIKESDLLPIPDEDEIEPEDEIKLSDVMGEIEDVAECPQCGAPSTIFDIECSDCGALFDTEEFDEDIIEDEFMEDEFTDDVISETIIEEEVVEEEIAEIEELTEEQMIIDSLELKDDSALEPETEIPLNGKSQEVLEEMESELELDEDGLDLGEDSGYECPECSSVIDKGAKECPVCGNSMAGGE